MRQGSLTSLGQLALENASLSYCWFNTKLYIKLNEKSTIKYIIFCKYLQMNIDSTTYYTKLDELIDSIQFLSPNEPITEYGVYDISTHGAIGKTVEYVL